MGILDKYLQEKEEYDKQHPIEMMKVRVDQNPNFNLSILKQNIDNIDNMTDQELYNFISRSYDSILYNIFTGVDAKKYITKFQNVRFLDAFISVLSGVNYIANNNIVSINTLCYHYITLPKEQQDINVINRILKLSNIVNKHYLPGLLGLGLNNNLASLLLIARFSDLNLTICVKRVDFIIINQPKELMTEKMIEEIFRKLYNVNEEFYKIFSPIMMDTIPEYDENNESWVTDEIDEVNSTLNLAILNILDNLPSQIIRNTILDYSEGQSSIYKNKPVRFSLRTLSEDYYRINNIVNQLIYNEGVYVI